MTSSKSSLSHFASGGGVQHSPHKLKRAQLSFDFCFIPVIFPSCCLPLLMVRITKFGLTYSFSSADNSKCIQALFSSGCLFIFKSGFFNSITVLVWIPLWCSDFCSPCCHYSSKLTHPFGHCECVLIMLMHRMFLLKTNVCIKGRRETHCIFKKPTQGILHILVLSRSMCWAKSWQKLIKWKDYLLFWETTLNKSY